MPQASVTCIQARPGTRWARVSPNATPSASQPSQSSRSISSASITRCSVVAASGLHRQRREAGGHARGDQRALVLQMRLQGSGQGIEAGGDFVGHGEAPWGTETGAL
jgi:hypothetical protein